MKKLLVLAVIACLGFSGAAAAQEGKSPFQIYLENGTPESFIAAYEEYEAQRIDTADLDATVMLAYLNLFELEKNLDILAENASGLGNGQKFQYANLLLELQRYDEAIGFYKELNEAVPRWSCPWRHRGEAHWGKGEYDEAVKALEKAIETRKEHYDAYIMLAEVLRDMKKYKRALKTLEEGLTYYGKDIEDPERETDSIEVQFLYLDLLKKAGEKEKYREQHEKLKKLAPDDERLER